MTLGGSSLRAAREAAGFPGKAGRAEFAKLVGVSPRTVEGWESSSGQVPDPKVALVRKFLDRSGDPLDSISNMDLVGALIKRLAAYEEMERRYRELLDPDRIRARDDEPQGDVYEISHEAKQIGGEGREGGRPHSGNPPRASWGRGPRPRSDRTRNDANDPDS